MTDMYHGYIDAFLDVIAEEIDPSDRLLDAARLLIGVDAALEYDRPITPDCRCLSEHEVAGQSFLEEYSPYY